MDNLTESDPTGVVAKCVRDLIKVGFDASAYEIAKWAGVACLIALLVLVMVTFLGRLWKDHALPDALSEQQFRWTILIGALLIALPVVAKVTGDQLNLETGSQDRNFAQRVCEERIDNLAKDADVEAVEQRVAALEAQLANINASNSSTTLLETDKTGKSLLGSAISLFHRTATHDSARAIEAILQDAGAGVALRETDLGQSPLLSTAVPGDIYIIYEAQSSDTVQAVRSILEAKGISVSGIRGPFNLTGNPVQVLLF